MKNIEELFAEFNCNDLKDDIVKNNVENIINQHFDENDNVEVYKQCLNQIDLTTLNGDDTTLKVKTMVEKFVTISPNTKLDDTIDAIAIAICHARNIIEE